MVDCKKCRKRYRADKVFFAGLAGGGRPVSVVLAFEANDKNEAARVLEAEQQRLVKKKKIPDGLTAVILTAKEAPVEWRRPCPAPECDGELTEPRLFNLMLETSVGALKDASSVAYLRPETAQG